MTRVAFFVLTPILVVMLALVTPQVHLHLELTRVGELIRAEANAMTCDEEDRLCVETQFHLHNLADRKLREAERAMLK